MPLLLGWVLARGGWGAHSVLTHRAPLLLLLVLFPEVTAWVMR
jgi:hypothetical protein